MYFSGVQSENEYPAASGSIFEFADVSNHVHIDGNTAAIPKRPLRYVVDRGLLDFPAICFEIR